MSCFYGNTNTPTCNQMELICMEMVTGVVLLTHKLLDSHCTNGSISLCVDVHHNEQLVNIKIMFSSIHSFNFDGSTVLSHLIKESFYLKQSIHSSVIRLIYATDAITTSVVELTSLSMYNTYTQTRLLSSPSLQLEAIEVPLIPPAKDITVALYQQLRLYHIINTHLSFLLRVSLSHSQTIQQYIFEGGGPSLSVPSSPFKLLSSIKHYLDLRHVSTSQVKLKVLRGVTCRVQDYSLNHSGHHDLVDLRLYSSVAILPELKLIPGRKIPADRLCNRLHIYVFTNGNLPLMTNGGQANFSLQDIALWSDYGITIGPPITCTTYCSEDMENVPSVPSFSFHLKPCSSRSLVDNGRAMHLFLFIELLETSHDTPLNHWTNSLTVISTLRNNFASLVKLHAKKFQRTCHSAMNKIFCNYSSFRKTKTSVSTSLPLLSEAVTNIISTSKSKTFKIEARHLLENEESEKSYEVLLDRLRDISHSKITDKGPEEPTTPELMTATTRHVSTSADELTIPALPVSNHDNNYVLTDVEHLSNFDSLTQLNEDTLSFSPYHSSVELHQTNSIHTIETQLIDYTDSSTTQVPDNDDEQIVPDIVNSDHEWDNEVMMSPLQDHTVRSPPISESDFKWD